MLSIALSSSFRRRRYRYCSSYHSRRHKTFRRQVRRYDGTSGSVLSFCFLLLSGFHHHRSLQGHSRLRCWCPHLLLWLCILADPAPNCKLSSLSYLSRFGVRSKWLCETRSSFFSLSLLSFCFLLTSSRLSHLGYCRLYEPSMAWSRFLVDLDLVFHKVPSSSNSPCS